MRKDERVVDLYGRYSHLGVLKLKLSKFADLKPKRFKTRRFLLAGEILFDLKADERFSLYL